MKARVVIGPQVRWFIASMAPEPRRKVWRAVKGLSEGKGDIKQLEGNLAPFRRLRVNNVRIVFDQKIQDGQRIVLCFFADYRATVYFVLEQLLASELLEELRNQTRTS